MSVKNTLNQIYFKVSMNKKNVLISIILMAISTILLKSGVETMAFPGITGGGPGVPP